MKTSPTDYAPFEQLRMFRYHNGRWTPFGSGRNGEDEMSRRSSGSFSAAP